jgi:hypothetical protein
MMQREMLSPELGISQQGDSAFTLLLAALAPLPMPCRVDAISRLRSAGADQRLLTWLIICLGIEAKIQQQEKELRLEASIPNMKSKMEQSSPDSHFPPAIVFEKDVIGSVFQFGRQEGIANTGDHAVNIQTANTPVEGEVQETSTEQSVQPNFQSEQELAVFLQDWVRVQWKSPTNGGTGRSGNVLLTASWKGQPALLKISADAIGMRAEAKHLLDLGQLGVGLSIAKLFAQAEAVEGDDRWLGYLMEPVGEMSLRDYLFITAPSPQKYLVSIGNGLSSLYCRTARPTNRDFVAEYLKSIRESVEKARGYATFARIASYFDGRMRIKGVEIVGPGAILSDLEERLQQGRADLKALNPAQDCHIHGDLHFENVRVNPAEATLGLYWLIDPKEFDRGDYLYDLAKLLTSLTGHAHVDIGEQEKDNPRFKWTTIGDGSIDFNCILTKRQAQGWKKGLTALESFAHDVAPHLERRDAIDKNRNEAVLRMKKRLLLVMARHYCSSVRFFLKPEAQWLLFARGTLFLALFRAALEGKDESEWDLFKICGESTWLETL